MEGHRGVGGQNGIFMGWQDRKWQKGAHGERRRPVDFLNDHLQFMRIKNSMCWEFLSLSAKHFSTDSVVAVGSWSNELEAEFC